MVRRGFLIASLLTLVGVVNLQAGSFVSVAPQASAQSCTALPATRTFTREGLDAVLFFFVEKAVKPFEDGIAIDSDPLTTAKICEMAGYQSVVSVSSRNFVSCGDNFIEYWTGSAWVRAQACSRQPYIDTLVCGNPVQCPANNATCTVSNFPSGVTAGQAFQATFTVNNNGNTTWTAPNYNLYDQGTLNNRWGQNGAPITSPIAPGQNATFTLNLTAPSTTGSFPFSWRMGQNAVGFFGQTCGGTITVNAPSGQCQNGIDDDGDGQIDLNDTGCTGPTDTDEGNPTVDLKINGQDGTISVAAGQTVTLTWTSTDAVRCDTGTSNMPGWGSFQSLPTSGSRQVTVTQSGTFGIQCAETSTSNMIAQDNVGVVTNAQCVQDQFNATRGFPEAQGWLPLDPGANQSTQILTEGGTTFLRITDNSTARGLRTEYQSITDAMLADKDWKIEMKARILASNSGPYPALTGMNMLLTSPAGKYVSIYIDTNKFGPIGPSLTQYEYGRTVNRNTSDAFHTYVIDHHKNGPGVNDDTFDILFDGQVVIPTITRNEIWNSGVWNQNINGISFGIGSSPGTGVMDVAYLRFTDVNTSTSCVNQCNDGIDNDGDGATDSADYSCGNGGNDETNPKSQCQDGIDNDGDGLIDFPADTGCTSRQDNTEQGGNTQCNDGIDNDFDGATDSADFSCSSPSDTDETNPKSQCQDNIDNDGDGLIDYPSDTGCTSRQDNTESGGTNQCNDGIDNDGDGATDSADFSCGNGGNDETNPKSQCQDGIDNDGDGLIDFPNDPGCSSKQDNSESSNTSQCSDGIDNDGDGAIDSADFSCGNNSDDDETNPKSQCQDGIDNDGDGLTDMNDPGCSSKQDNDETTGSGNQCADGIDNDGDGAVDLNDFSCSSSTDTDETNPKSQCQDGIDNDGDSQIDFPNDAGCTSKQDNDETAGSGNQCADGIDNDFDGATDLADFSCSSSTDTDETNPKSQCQDGIDNDGDGLIDYPSDTGCTSRQDNDEGGGSGSCSDNTLTIDIEEEEDPVQPGDDIEYEITLENDCGSSRTLTVIAQLDSDMEFEDASNGGDETQDGEVRWQNITLNANDERTLKLTVSTDEDDVEDGDEVELEVIVGNVSETETTDIGDDDGGGTGGATDSFSVSVQPDRSEAQPGDVVNYTITIRNNGTNALTAVSLENTFTSGQLSILDAAGATVEGTSMRWNFDRIEPSTSRQIRFTTRMGTSMRNGDVVANTTRLSANGRTTSGSGLVRIVTQLPQTGIGRLMRSTSNFLSPASNATAQHGTGSSAAAVLAWLATIGSGAGVGGLIGKKFFI